MKEAVETPTAVYNTRVHFAALIASFAAIIIGYDAGFIGGTVILPEFEREFGLDKMSGETKRFIKANIISLFHVGAFFGSYLVYPIGIYWGRIKGFKLAGWLITIGSFIQLLSNHTRGLRYLMIGRILCGIGIGAVSNLAPMYVSEISPPSIRGRLVGMYEISWQVGGIFGFFINFGTEQLLQGSNKQWQTPIAVQIIPALMFLVGVFFIKESPRWYFSVNRRDMAIRSLCYLRGLPLTSEYINYELETMEIEAIERKQALQSEFWGPLKLIRHDKSVQYRLLLTSSLFVFQNTSGINAIIYYSVSILKTLGIGSTAAGLLSTGVFGVIKGICCFIWAFWIIDNFGRKPPVILGSLVCFLALFYLGIYIKIADPEANISGEMTLGSKIALMFFYIWTISFAFSWSGFPWVYMSEVFDLKVRNLAQCFNASSNWFWAFIFARFAQNIIDALEYGTFLLFGILLLVSTGIFALMYPETSGIPMSDIDLLFEENIPPWKAHSRALEIIKEREQAHDHTGIIENNELQSELWHSNELVAEHGPGLDSPKTQGRHERSDSVNSSTNLV